MKGKTFLSHFFFIFGNARKQNRKKIVCRRNACAVKAQQKKNEKD